MKEYQPIRGRDQDGAYRSSPDVRIYSAELRRKRVADGRCINSSAHGSATHGGRCKRCFAVHRYGAALVEQIGLDNLDLSDRRRFNKFPSAALAA